MPATTPCGSRKVTCITEITGMESGKIQLQDVFRFVSRGYAGERGAHRIQGYFTGCGMVPTFYEELRATGAQLDMGLFTPHPDERDDADDDRVTHLQAEARR